MRKSLARNRSNITKLFLLGSLVLVSYGSTSAHEGHTHAQEGSSTSTRIQINTNTDTTTNTSGGSSLRVRIENRINSQKEIRLKKEIRINQSKSSLEQKLSEIKDEQKKKIAERLTTQMNRINDIRSERYLNRLEHLEKILEKLEQRAKDAQTNGADVSNILNRIVTIRTSIETATAKIEAQQDKVYTVEIQSTQTLGQDFSNVHNQLKSDLTAIHNEIKTTKQNISDVFHDLRALKSTPSPTP